MKRNFTNESFRRIQLSTIAILLMFAAAAQADKYPASITVALDGSGNYKSIQAAINSTRDLGKERVIIHIKNGTYHEKVIVPSWKTNISLVGESKDSTIISNNDYSGKVFHCGDSLFGLAKFNTYTSYTLLVQGNDFIAENLTIENAAGRVGQAVALHVEGDRVQIKNCKLLGNQDTLYAATENSRQYYVNCYIEGTTDFIFGEACALFENCTIKSLTNSYITAAATRQGQPFGFVLMHCKLISDTSAQKVFLGRPWRPYAKTVYLQCELGAHILPAGWNEWKGDAMFPDKEKTAYYAEYQNKGAGASTKERVAWSKQLTAKQAKQYTIANIFKDWKPE